MGGAALEWALETTTCAVEKEREEEDGGRMGEIEGAGEKLRLRDGVLLRRKMKNQKIKYPVD